MLSYDDLKKKYPNKTPIIVNRAAGCKLNELPKNKFLVFNSMTLGEFQLIIRKYLKLNSNESLIFFINKCLIPNTDLLSKIQETHHRNNFLIIEYSSENTFG